MRLLASLAPLVLLCFACCFGGSSSSAPHPVTSRGSIEDESGAPVANALVVLCLAPRDDDAPIEADGGPDITCVRTHTGADGTWDQLVVEGFRLGHTRGTISVRDESEHILAATYFEVPECHDGIMCGVHGDTLIIPGPTTGASLEGVARVHGDIGSLHVCSSRPLHHCALHHHGVESSWAWAAVDIPETATCGSGEVVFDLTQARHESMPGAPSHSSFDLHCADGVLTGELPP